MITLTTLPLPASLRLRGSSCSYRRWLAMMAVFVLVGCAEMPATVSGKVTVGGQTHEGLRVSFIPQAGGATALSKTDKAGRYSIQTGAKRGLEPGEYRVTVSGYSSTPSPTMSKAQVDALRIVGVEHSNRKTSPHLTTIEPGGNVFDLDLPAP